MQFDVFVSFRGKDTRTTFTANLLEYLRRKGVHFYSDGKLLRGENLSVLFEKIKQSKMSIVVFSKNYANSTWCLEELRTIMQCKREFGHGVLPIFYKVPKSDVENQNGSYEDAFRILAESFNGDEHKLEELKDAMKTAANIAGFVYRKDRYDQI